LLAEELSLSGGYGFVEAASGQEGLEKARDGGFDAVLLDVGLPDADGRDICRAMRDAGVKVPIILLTAADSDADEVLGLDSGANDYVVKPAKAMVLKARIQAHLRQFESSEDATFPLGAYTFAPSQKQLLADTGKPIRLTVKETDILKFLYRADGPVSREKLLGEVWGYNAEVTTHTLETHIYRLRRKIEEDPAKPVLLVTDQNGYRLCK